MRGWSVAYVNPDFSARGPFGDLNPFRSVLKATQKAAGIREHRWSEEKGITFETVLSTRVMEESMGKIISRYAKSLAKCFLIEKISNRFYRYDNSVEEQACLLFRVANGALIKIYESINPWASEIVGVLDVASSNENRK
jgi:predicted ABC-type ATPase